MIVMKYMQLVRCLKKVEECFLTNISNLFWKFESIFFCLYLVISCLHVLYIGMSCSYLRLFVKVWMRKWRGSLEFVLWEKMLAIMEVLTK